MLALAIVPAVVGGAILSAQTAVSATAILTLQSIAR